MVKRGVILDVDGTLVDSNEAHVESWHRALADFGIVTRPADVRRLVGMGGDQLLPAISGLEEESELGERIAEHRRKLFVDDYLASIRPWPDSEELIGRLHQSGRRLVVATSTDRETAEQLLRLADPHRLVREAVSSSDVVSSKPAPDLVRSALARLPFAAGEVVLLGDTPYDVAAAKALGVETIAFTCGGWSQDDLAGALEVWRGPEDLLDHWDRSVLGAASHRKAA